jgi:HTH-type transcriptional regulator/antitoxin HigA
LRILKACNSPITSDTELEVRMQLIDDLPALFAHMITDRVYEYEQKNLNIPNVKSSEALAFFMQERDIKQKDLSEIAPQNVISEILNEKRKMTVEQIKGFAHFFAVPETTFLG